MKRMLSTLAVLSLTLTGAAYAHDDHAEDTVVHYEAPKPATVDAAFAQLEKVSAEIAEILKKEKLADSDFETVHEKSYALKSANAKLEEHVAEGKKAQFATLKDETEEVHEEAEEHKEAGLRKHFVAFNAALEAYKAK